MRGVVPPLLAAGGAALGVLAVHLRDPHIAGTWGLCPFSLLSGGLDCPGCGALRAIHHLTDGDLSAAVSSNLLLVAALPLVLVGWALWLRRAATGRPLGWRVSPALLVPVLAVVVAGFTVLRNVPAGAWLHS